MTKNDILDYVASGKAGGGQPFEEKKEEDVMPVVEKVEQVAKPVPSNKEEAKREEVKPTVEKEQPSNGDEHIPLTRMGKLIVQHMTASVNTSAHVQSFVEVDVGRREAYFYPHLYGGCGQSIEKVSYGQYIPGRRYHHKEKKY